MWARLTGQFWVTASLSSLSCPASILASASLSFSTFAATLGALKFPSLCPRFPLILLNSTREKTKTRIDDKPPSCYLGSRGACYASSVFFRGHCLAWDPIDRPPFRGGLPDFVGRVQVGGERASKLATRWLSTRAEPRCTSRPLAPRQRDPQ